MAAQSQQLIVPDLGEIEQAEITELSIAPGATFAEGDTLAVLESEKAAFDLPAPHAGSLIRWLVQPGAVVSSGAVLAELEAQAGAADKPTESATDAADSSAADAPQQPEPVAPVSTGAQPAPEPTAPPRSGKAYAGPGARKLARQLGVDLSQVRPTGERGRIRMQDIHTYVKANLGGGSELLKPQALADFSPYGVVRREKVSRMNRTAAANLHRSWVNIPHVTHHDEADVTELEVLRRRMKKDSMPTLTAMSFLLVACTRVLKDFPKFRSSLDENTQELIVKEYYDIGMAVDTERGLLVPVLRGVDRQSLEEISHSVRAIAERTRAGELKMDEMRGACFSISNLGGVGGTGFTPIINHPEVAILGVSSTAVRLLPAAEGVEPRQFMPLSLSYNHKVINGVEAARFMRALADQLQKPDDLV